LEDKLAAQKNKLISKCGITGAWLKGGIWKLRGIRRGYEKGRCPLYLEKDVKHILLSCLERKSWGKFSCNE
jgi:hypothetical protein